MKFYDKDLLYLDNHIACVNKPAGVVTQSCSQENIEDALREYLQQKKAKQKVFLHAVHRIDKPVSGIVLFACTSKALSRLNAAMRERKFNKTYWARIEGKMPFSQGKLVHYIKHGNFCAEISDVEKPSFKEAELYYKVCDHQRYPLIEIALKTGRYHQIRVQLSHIGCPIYGDGKYGAQNPQQVIALHQGQLQFPHPTKKNQIMISLPIPFA